MSSITCTRRCDTAVPCRMEKKMKRPDRHFSVFRMLLLAAISLGAAASPAYTAGATVRAGLAQANAAAQKWQKDAVLTGVGTPGPGPEGTSNLWQYDFYSPKTKKCARIALTARDGQTKTRELQVCAAPRPIAGEFVDSPQVAAEARKNGFNPGEMNTMTLEWLRDNNVKTGVYWSVSSEHDFDPAKAVTRGWCIEPKTG